MKTIGLLTDIEVNKISLNFAYFEFASIFGAVKLIHPLENIHHRVDLLILPGGADVHPLRYGETKIPWQCGYQNEHYEYFDAEILPAYIQSKTPIFGICRGLQTINVLLGGSLHQDVDEPNSGSERGKPVHWVRDTRTGIKFEVNSLHHQAIKGLAPNFDAILVGTKKKEDRYIEAIKHRELPILATQFHPEELNNQKTLEAWNWTINEIRRIMVEPIVKGALVKETKEVF